MGVLNVMLIKELFINISFLFILITKLAFKIQLTFSPKVIANANSFLYCLVVRVPISIAERPCERLFINTICKQTHT